MKTSSFTKDSQMKNVTKEYKNLDETDTKTITPIDVSQNHSNPTERISSFDGQTFVLEYLAPRRSCRVNVVITAFANGTFHFYVQLKMLCLFSVLSYDLSHLLPTLSYISEMKPNAANKTNTVGFFFNKLVGSPLNTFYRKHPMVLTSLLSILFVTMLCSVCLIFQYKFEKKKHKRWYEAQRQQKEKFRRKSSCSYSNGFYLNGPDPDGYVPVCVKNDDDEADIETVVSVMGDDYSPLMGNRKKVSRKKLVQILNKRFQNASKILQIQRNKNGNRMCRTNSIPLPCEPFTKESNTLEFRRTSANEWMLNGTFEKKKKIKAQTLITSNQLKKSLASKIKRCRKGTYDSSTLRSRPPPPAPTSSPVPTCHSDHETMTWKEKRYSRSFSDLLSIIELTEDKTTKLLIRRSSEASTSTYSNNNNINSSNKTTFTGTTTASIETVVHHKKGKP